MHSWLVFFKPPLGSFADFAVFGCMILPSAVRAYSFLGLSGGVPAIVIPIVAMVIPMIVWSSTTAPSSTIPFAGSPAMSATVSGSMGLVVLVILALLILCSRSAGPSYTRALACRRILRVLSRSASSSRAW